MPADAPQLSVTLIRSLSLLPLVMVVGVIAFRRYPTRVVGAAFLAFLWNCIALLAVNAVAVPFGWWRFGVTEGMFWSTPLDLLLSWALLWGALPVLLARRSPLVVAVLGLVALDLAAMPLLAPVVQLESSWLIGEALAVVVALVPGLVLARFTIRRSNLPVRVAMQMVLFAALTFFFVPTAVFSAAGSSWMQHVDHLTFATGLIALQVAMVLGAPALISVNEFAQRGGGTPYPWDPPMKLVMSGPYAFVANPMQTSMTLLLLVSSLVVRDWWIAILAVSVACFSAGIAELSERGHLGQRFGGAWRDYRSEVHNWRVRWRPASMRPEGRLYVAVSCDPCSMVGTWFARRNGVRLRLLPAEVHPEVLQRVRYEADGVSVSGIVAIAYALEHLNFGWAMLGWFLRLPVIRTVAQVLVDAMGGGPQPVPARAGASCAAVASDAQREGVASL